MQHHSRGHQTRQHSRERDEIRAQVVRFRLGVARRRFGNHALFGFEILQVSEQSKAQDFLLFQTIGS